MDELTSEFLAETVDSFAQLDELMLVLEEEPANEEVIRDAFRILHTVKGTCGFLGFENLQRLAHATENIFTKLRDDQVEAPSDIIEIIFKSIDELKNIVQRIQQNGNEGDEDQEILERLKQAMDTLSGTTNLEKSEPQLPESNLQSEESVLQGVLQESVEEELETGDKENSDDKLEETFPEESIEVVEKPKSKTSPQVSVSSERQASSNKASQSIRLNLDVIDNLMTLVSELVLSRNQLLQLDIENPDTIFSYSLNHLSQLISELQEQVMKTRMQPIQTAWANFPRMIRDLSHDLGKKVNFVHEGGGTDVDRQVLDVMKDPLMHIVRNAVDHGIEIPEVRLSHGKEEMGSIKVNSYHEGGRIVIEIKDDGKGLDVEAIRRKIIEKNLASASEVELLDDSSVFQYIFMPGFTTAQKISNVSGRGVGMDVVKTNIEKIGGTIGLNSVVNQGTAITIRIPLTLTIISSLLVEVGRQRFAVPQSSVLELVLVSPHSSHQVEYLNKKSFLRLRDKLIPLVFVRNILHLGEKEGANPNLYVLVCKVNGIIFGVVVDCMYDTQEIVVKPLPSKIQNEFFSGSTILGDGSVVMIIDPNRIHQNCMKNYNESEKKRQILQKSNTLSNNKTQLLIFRVGERRYATFISLVTRIDEVYTPDIQTIDGQLMVQYRSNLLPILAFDNHIDHLIAQAKDKATKMQAPEEGDGKTTEENISMVSDEIPTLPMLVFSDRGRSVAIVIEEILNIVEDNLDIQIKKSGEGNLGTTLIQGEPTTLINCEHYLKKVYKDWCDPNAQVQMSEKINHGVLLIDDSRSFLNVITPILTIAGYDVLTAMNGVEGLKVYNKHHNNIKIIISDIEMPEMDGIEFVRTVKNLPNWSAIPIVALSGRTSEGDIQEMMEAGYDDYIAKTDQTNQQALLSIIKNTIENSQKPSPVSFQPLEEL